MATTKVTKGVIADNAVGIDQLDVTDGSNGQVLSTNGSGTLSFTTISGYTDSDVETYLDSGTSTPTFGAMNTNGAITLGNASYWIGNATNGYRFNDSADTANLLVIKDNGNVGIGTSTAPAANGGGLAIYRSDYPRITLRNSTSGDTTSDGFQAALVGSDMQWDLAESGSQKFFTGGSERMRINSNGTVGIGSGSRTDQMLMIQGAAPQIELINTSNSYAPLSFVNNTNTSSYNDIASIGAEIDSGNAKGRIVFKTRNTDGSGSQAERMRISSSGAVGIKSSSPDYTLSVAGVIEAEPATELAGSNAGANFLHYSTNNYSYFNGAYGANGVFFGEATGATRVGMQSGQTMTFETSGTERMRLLASRSEVLINRTSAFGAGSTASLIVGSASDQTIRVLGPNTSGYTWIGFFNGGLGQIGSISNNSNTNTSFNTSSDYRLKQNVNDNWDATSILKQLRPVEFTWIADETNEVHQGFLAHEAQEHLPFAVLGEKDATQDVLQDEDGNDLPETAIKPQQMDYSKVVPLLVKTIQELEVRIATLESA